MALSLATLGITAPLLATSAIQLQNNATNTKSEATTQIKLQKCHYFVRASSRMTERRQSQINNCGIVLRDGGLYLRRQSQHEKGKGLHELTSYMLPYPSTSYDGLVTTINDENMLNWVFVDAETYQLRYGVRKESQAHLTGPVDLLMTADGEKRLTFEGWEGFVVVKGRAGEWGLYFDRDDDGLRQRAKGSSVVEVEVVRAEIEEAKTTEESNSTDRG